MSKPFLFCCPITGLMVQGDTNAPTPDEGEPPRYESVTCLACQYVHIVNPHTGRLLSDDLEQS
jgi:hypothetical protein